MSAGRETVLRRIRAALRDVPQGEQPSEVVVARDYRLVSDESRAELVGQFAERVAEYRARVRRVVAAELSDVIGAACAERGARRIVVPADIPAEWLPDTIEPLVDENLSYGQLDESDGVLTGCALGIAQTGTIVLDAGARQGRRVISLLPDYHLCVVLESQIVGMLPEAIAGLEGAARAGQPLTFISGPSATSDIELNRVEGVHGPRTLEVLIVA